MNIKQERFVQEYLIDTNATQAAIRVGYSEKTAYSQGQRLLKHVEVAEAIAKGLEDKRKRSRKSADWVIERLEHEAQKAESDAARVSALDKLGKVHGIFEKDNSQGGVTVNINGRAADL